MRRRSKQPSSVELFEDLYHYVAAPTERVGQVLAGHLAIEFLMRKLVSLYDPKLQGLADELTHARLIALNTELGNLSPERAAVLVKVNTLRNHFAHDIRYEPELPELTTLFATAAAAFTDYSDGIRNGLTALRAASSVYSLDKWLLTELFLAVLYDLHQEFIALGGDEERP